MANVPWIGTGGLPLLGSGGAPLICDDAVDCACEPGEVIIETCADLEECLGGTDPISVTISGVTDDVCEDCEFIDNTYILDGEFTSCAGLWGELDAGAGACCTGLGVRVDMIFDEATPPAGTFILVQFRCTDGSGDQAHYLVELEDAEAAIYSLCNTGSATIPYYPDTSTWTDCDWPATVLLEI